MAGFQNRPNPAIKVDLARGRMGPVGRKANMAKHCFWILILLPLAALPGCGGKDGGTTDGAAVLRLGFMPKLVPIPYFQACKRGAEEAAAELRISLVYN